MKWIRLVLWKIQRGQNSVHRRTDGRTNRRTMWNQYTPHSTSLKRGDLMIRRYDMYVIYSQRLDHRSWHTLVYVRETVCVCLLKLRSWQWESKQKTKKHFGLCLDCYYWRKNMVTSWYSIHTWAYYSCLLGQISGMKQPGLCLAAERESLIDRAWDGKQSSLFSNPLWRHKVYVA